MLMPKRVKHRKQFRGSMRGKALSGNAKPDYEIRSLDELKTILGQ